jgi:5-methylcytosine-specific restriction endonuclease McrA
MEPTKLPLNLIPATSWWKNVRSEISKSQWDLIRKKVYQQANYTCEICGLKNVRLDCNEVWDYKDNKQILVRLEAICRPCHLTQHLGYAAIIGKHQEAFNHLIKVNKWTGEQGMLYIQKKWQEWEERSKITWTLDYEVLEKYERE